MISDNQFTRIGIVAGMGSGGQSGQYSGIALNGVGIMCRFNYIDSVGYSGIRILGALSLPAPDAVIIQNNYVADIAMTLDDVGAIYLWGPPVTTTSSASHKVIGNIVLRGVGAKYGTNNTSSNPAVQGIYMDDYVKNVEISGNTVAYFGGSGLFLHNSAYIRAVLKIKKSKNYTQLPVCKYKKESDFLAKE